MKQKTNSSMRQLLIKRARCHQLTSRLRNNMEEIEQKTEKLAQSRCSSRSSPTYKQSKLNYSTEVRQKSPKIRLLQDIVDKLKCAKKELDKDIVLNEQLYRTPEKQKQKKIKIEEEKLENIYQNSPTRKKSKLQALLKDIKKCNQESTKAVITIKKDRLKSTQKDRISSFQIPIPKTQKTVKQEIGERLTEIVTLKEELRKAKQQNKLLNQIIQINQITEGRSWNKDRQCIKCRCSCSRKVIHPESFDRVSKKG